MRKQPQKILIVDDEPDVGMILKSILSKNGFEAEQCLSLKQYDHKVSDFDPDVLILDIDLPDGSGLAKLPEIKSKRPQMKVIINSALDTNENRQKADEGGASAFLGKPLNKEQLLHTIDNL